MSTKSTYLLTYNIISLTLWALLLVLIPVITTYHPLQSLYNNLLIPLLAPTQSLAVLEIIHASQGLVRASPLTTALQVIGKNLVVWTVMVPFPELMKETKVGLSGYVGCLVAWSLSEVLRYGYFVVLLRKGEVGGGLKWLRYSAFMVLYPIGILSEMALVYLAWSRAEGINIAYRIYLFLGLLTYIPASYILYGHMLSQRRRILSGKPQDTTTRKTE